MTPFMVKTPMGKKHSLNDGSPSHNTPGQAKKNPLFYIKKSQKKLTVPVEPQLSTNERASRRESIGKHGSFWKESDSSLTKIKLDSESFLIYQLEELFASTIGHANARSLAKSPSQSLQKSPILWRTMLPRNQSVCKLENEPGNFKLIKKPCVAEYKNSIPRPNDPSIDIKKRIF